MHPTPRFSLALPAIFVLLVTGTTELSAQSPHDWPVHSMERPRPPVVEPGPAGSPQAPPSDAIILFDGTDLDAWRSEDGGPAKWRVGDGWLEVAGGTGSIRTAESFGDVQLHVEWRAPSPPTADGQNRGNSGVYLMGTYEVQVLDSYGNDTYADGQAASFYGQYPPLVNAMRPPGEWQTYDIIFRRPRFDDDGDLVSPARATVIHNGVLVQDNVELTGPTAHYERPPYQSHAARLPLMLQDHGDPVRFRNIWVRPLEPLDGD